ncbi:hypothetical protein D9611_001127 [Ephemerocybe angulata]|uniref:CENP-V/GFA domain-containing protein n=1 Tax=Ephemerocybe angulata TaxID=980116 RepID=A0A8H5CIH2_9AGAR|nr:hypothetical protein D9611_001127 [Tulosesus angulatus]
MPSKPADTDTMQGVKLTMVRKGSCLCKAVRYELEGEPVWFRVCHCVNCRKATGAAFMANVLFPAKSFRIKEGEGALRVYEDRETASGVPMQRWFCGGCGSNVYMRSTGAISQGEAGWVVVQSGCIDDDDGDNDDGNGEDGERKERGGESVGGKREEWKPTGELFAQQRRGWVGVEVRESGKVGVKGAKAGANAKL